MPTTSPSIHELQLNTPPNSVDPDEESESSSSSASPPRSSEDSNSCDALTVDTATSTVTQDSQLTQLITPPTAALSPPNSEKSCDLAEGTSMALNHSSLTGTLESRALSRRQALSTDSSSEDGIQDFYDEAVATDVDTESCDDCEVNSDDASTDCGSDDEDKSHFTTLWKEKVQPVSYCEERSGERGESELCLPAADKIFLANYQMREEEESLSAVEEDIPSVEAYVEVHTSEEGSFEVEKNVAYDDNSGAEDWRLFSGGGSSPSSMWQETCTATAFYGTDPVDLNVVFAHGRPEEFCRGIPTPDLSPGGSYSSETQLVMETENGDGEKEFNSTYSGIAENELEAAEFEGARRFVGRPLIELVLETHQPMDTVITLADGKLGAHRLVLSAASALLQELLIEQDARKTSTLILPDISKKTMELLLTLAYTGQVAFTLDEEADLFSAVSMLLFGQNFDMSVHELPPRQKPLPPPPPELMKQESREEDSAGELDEEEDNCSVSCSSSFRVNQVSIDSSSKSGKNWATFGEVRVVSYCHGCNTQWKTLDRAQKCLLSHGLARCWVCFEVFSKAGIRGHYLTNHCDESSLLDAHKTFIRCRWCPKKVNIKSSIGTFSSHAVTHVPQNQTAKGGRRKSAMIVPEEVEDAGEAIAAFEETKTLDGQSIYLRYKTLKGEETLVMEELSTSLRPPASPPRIQYIVDDTNKCHLDLNNFPKVFIQLNRLPVNVEDRIFRRDLPPTPVSESSAIPDTKTETILEERDVEDSSDLPDMDPGSPQPISIVNIQNLMDEEEHQGNPKRIRKRSVTPLRLSTPNWGHVNLLAQNLSEQDFKGFPKTGSLVLGRDSSADMWNQIEAMKLKGMEMVVLRMTCSDATCYAELFSYLSTEDRVGLITNERMSKGMEIILVPLTPENHARMEKLFSAPVLDEAEQLESLVAIVVQLNSLAGPGPGTRKRSTRGLKRRLDSPQPSVVKAVPVSAVAGETPTRRSNRKRPKVIPLVQLEDGDVGSNELKESSGLAPGKIIECVPIPITTMAADTTSFPVNLDEPDSESY